MSTTGLGSVIGELDANNTMTTSRQYDVYGAPRAGTQQGVAATSSQGYVGSLGHVTDQSTGGQIYMQARYYDPGVGRFKRLVTFYVGSRNGAERSCAPFYCLPEIKLSRRGYLHQVVLFLPGTPVTRRRRLRCE